MKFKNRHKVKIFSTVAVFCVSLLMNCSGINYEIYYEKGALATASPIATEIGRKVFKEGGNAFDAAVAVGFVLAVVHPEAGNIGGGGFAIIRSAETGIVEALDFRETAPDSAYEKMYLTDDGEVVKDLSIFGSRAVGVPGTVAGLHQLWQKNGSFTWEKLVGYSAELADNGFVVDQYLADAFSDYRSSLSAFKQSADIFFPEGRALQAGDTLVQKNLAKTLYLIAAEGPDVFYKGEIADSLAATMVEHDGLITKDDLASYKTIWREPIKFRFDSLDIYSMPPPSSGGILLNQILKMIEPYDLNKYSPESVEYIHLFTEISKRAFADRSEYLGDPAFYSVPVNMLINENYLENRAAEIDLDHATPSDQIKAGVTTFNESDQTTHFSVCDSEGNMVSVTYTLNTSFGSKLMINGCGVLLNNEMDDFSVKPGVPNYFGLVGGEANKIEPSKRMLSSMSPTLILKNNQPFMALGSPGGSKIITVVAQAILNFTRFNLTLDETAAQKRFHHQWLPDVLYLEESSFDINTKQDLIRMGHDINERSRYSDLQMLYITESMLIGGASDPRNRGTVSGY